MAVYETKDIHKFDELKTRYFANSYEQCKTAVLDVAKKLGYEVLNVDDRYNEIYISGKKYSIVIKIVSFNPRDTGVDFYVQSLGMLDLGKGKKHIVMWYDELAKGLQFKGIALHANG